MCVRENISAHHGGTGVQRTDDVDVDGFLSAAQKL